jgi:hypothetical protein
LRLRESFAARHDPYAGGDLDNARRLAVFLWLLGTALTLALLPFSPPTEVIGDAGWVLAGLLVAIALWIAFALYRGWLSSRESLLIPSYASVLGVCTMQWLAGGVDAPYEVLLLLPVVYVAAIQPPRKIAPFLLFIGVANERAGATPRATAASRTSPTLCAPRSATRTSCSGGAATRSRWYSPAPRPRAPRRSASG